MRMRRLAAMVLAAVMAVSAPAYAVQAEPVENEVRAGLAEVTEEAVPEAATAGAAAEAEAAAGVEAAAEAEAMAGAEAAVEAEAAAEVDVSAEAEAMAGAEAAARAEAPAEAEAPVEAEPAAADLEASEEITGWAVPLTEEEADAMPPLVGATVPTEQQVYNAMIALKTKYPEGMSWTNDNGYAWKGGIYSAGYGCAAFAFILSDAAFGSFPARRVEPVSFANVRVGDILRINGDTHSVIILEKKSDHVVIAEGNFNRSIHWGRTLSRAEVNQADYYLTRWPSEDAASLRSLAFEDSSTDLWIGEYGYFDLKAEPEEALPYADIHFTSSDPSVLKVNDDGSYESLKTGAVTVTMTAEKGKFKDTMYIIVEHPNKEMVSFPSQTEAAKQILSLRSAFPEGRAWGNEWSYYWVDWDGSFGTDIAAEGSLALVLVVSDELFGKAPLRWVEECRFDDILIGDILENDEEGTFILLGKSGDDAVVLDASSGRIRWGARAIPRETLEAEYERYTRYPEDYGEKLESTRFIDVLPNAYYADPVAWAVENEITSGTSAYLFSPDAACTRGQAVTFLWRAAGCPEPEMAESPFKDLKAGAYYEKAVLWAVENNITSGTSATTFSPNAACSRGQIVTFLYRYMGSPDAGSGSTGFSDVKAGAYYENPVRWAVQNSVTSGISKTEFGPGSDCTRGQIVTFLYRAVG